MESIIRVILSAAIFAFIGLFAVSAEEANAHDLTPEFRYVHLTVKCPLCAPAASGDLEKLKELLDAGEDPNQFFLNGHRPLGFAARNNQVESARMLIEAGADVNGHGGYHHTPLEIAAIANHPEMASLLIEAEGIDLHHKNFQGWMPIHVAMRYDHKEIALMLNPLYTKSAAANAHNTEARRKQGPLGIVPEIMAVIGDHFILLEQINRAGGLRYTPDVNWADIVHYAAYKGNPEFLNSIDLYYFERRPARKDANGRTALMYAASRGNMEYVDYFLGATEFFNKFREEQFDHSAILDDQGYSYLDYLNNPNMQGDALDPPLVILNFCPNWVVRFKGICE